MAPKIVATQSSLFKYFNIKTMDLLSGNISEFLYDNCSDCKNKYNLPTKRQNVTFSFLLL
jgi:hypothetical protein